MATLKYRKSDGTFISIPSVQGPAGNGIASITQTSSSNASGGNNVWTATMTNGTTATFTVKNGAQGEKGDKGDNYGDGIYLPLTGGKLTGKLTLQTTTTIADNEPAYLQFSVIQSDNNIATSSGFIKFYDDHDAAANGGTMVIQSAGNMVIGSGESPAACYSTDLIGNTGENTYITSDSNIYFYTNCQTYSSKKSTVYIDTAGALYGAVWNDYAEYREVNTTEPGRAVYEIGDDTLAITDERMMPACSIISDTFGFAIGKTEKCQTPLAQAGRVLAYPLEDRNSYKPGDAVCSGPNGTVSKMTQEEKVNHPECIIGYVSCIPSYDIWGEKDTKVNGRIWIKVV